MERVTLEARKRTESGSADARRQRREGWVPANMYGHGEANVSFLIRHEEIHRAVHAEHHLMTIDLGGTTESGLLKEIQFDTFGDRILHADFARVSLDEVVETTVAIHVAGAPKTGTLDVAHHELTLRGKARDLPESVEVDVTSLAVGEAIRVKDLSLPDGVAALLDGEEAVIAIHHGAVEADDDEVGEEPAAE